MVKRAGERGAAAVEFALVVPIVMGVVGLIATAALGFTFRAIVQRGAEVGARAVAVPLRPYVFEGPERYRTAAEVTAAVDAATPLITPRVTFSHDLGTIPENGTFTVTTEWTWSNPLFGLVALATRGGGDAASLTFRASAEGVRE